MQKAKRIDALALNRYQLHWRGFSHLSVLAQKAGIHPVIWYWFPQWQQSILCRSSPKIRKDSTNSWPPFRYIWYIKNPFEKRRTGFLNSFIIYPLPEKYFVLRENEFIGVHTRISSIVLFFLPLVPSTRQTSYSCRSWISPPKFGVQTHIDLLRSMDLNRCLAKPSPIEEQSWSLRSLHYSYADMVARLRESQLPDRQLHKKIPRTLSVFPPISKAVKNRRASSFRIGNFRLPATRRLSKVRLNRYPNITPNNNPTDRKGNSNSSKQKSFTSYFLINYDRGLLRQERNFYHSAGVQVANSIV